MLKKRKLRQNSEVEVKKKKGGKRENKTLEER